MSHHDGQFREVGGYVVEQHRVGVAQLDAVPAREPGADTRLARVEQRRHPRLGDRLVDGVEAAVVRLEGLHAGMKLETLDAVVADQLVHAVRRAPLMPRIDAAERDKHVVVAYRPRDQILDRVRHMPHARARVDGEDHGAVLCRRYSSASASTLDNAPGPILKYLPTASASSSS